MSEVDENLDCLLHDRVGFAAFEISDEADATRVVLEAWIVKTLFARLKVRLVHLEICGSRVLLIQKKATNFWVDGLNARS